MAASNRRARLPHVVRVAAFSVAILALAGCQGPPPVVVDTSPKCAVEGSASRQVVTSGDLFESPNVEFPRGITAITTQRSVAVEGDGPIAALGSIVAVDFVAYNAREGEKIESSGYSTAGIGHTLIALDLEHAAPGIRHALICSQAGSRVVAVVPSSEAFGDKGGDFGLQDGDAIVYVFDVLTVAGDRASGKAVDEEPGLPSVTLEDSGLPRIAIPVEAPPRSLTFDVLRKGDGIVVRSGSDVVLRYRGVLWRNGVAIDENWSHPSLEITALDDMLPGVVTAVTGQTVGSQVIVVVPPSAGWGSEGNVSGSVAGSDTLVYVIDILASS